MVETGLDKSTRTIKQFYLKKMILQTLIKGDFISLTVESFQFHLSLSFQIQEETETFRTFDVALRHG